MSGISGIIHFDGKPADPALIRRMTDAMAYRGPDGIHHFVRGNVALGHLMLHTTLESLEETQPLANEDQSLVLVMDGRVDNWEELRRELLQHGARLRTRADAELVLRAYETWGKDCLSHIDGDFAIAIWNENKRELFCARDRVGNKPFTYHFDGTTLAFASELHALLELPWVPQVPNEGMIAEIMADEWMTRDETIWSGINRLVASHRMSVSAGKLKTSVYWRPDVAKPLAYKRDEDYFEHYRTLFFDTVRRLSRSHKPVAYEVSGGLDSSSIFCVAETLRRDARLPAPGLGAYTLAFYDDPNADETSYAQLVGKYLGLPVRETKPAYHELSWYEDIARRDREISGYPNGAMSTSLYESAAADGCRVVVGGVGGDHFLCGTWSYYAEALATLNFADLERCFMADVEATGLRSTLTRFARRGLLPFAPQPVRTGLRTALRAYHNLKGQRKRGAYWLAPELRDLLATRSRSHKAAGSPHVCRLGQSALFTSMDHALDACLRELWGKSGSRFQLEIRQPFFDRKFIEFAFETPDRLRSLGNQSKIIHREALKGLIPDEIRCRETKAEFAGVFDFRLQSLRDTFTALPKIYPEWLDESGMQKLWETYETHSQDGWQIWCLWSILSIDFALRTRIQLGAGA